MNKYKRPAVDEDLYFQMAEDAVRKRQSVKSWLTEAIKEKLGQKDESQDAKHREQE